MNNAERESPVSALMVGEYEEDRQVMHSIFSDMGWNLYEAQNRRHAIQCLKRHLVQVVLAEGAIPQWNWKYVLRDLRRLSRPPQLVVTSKLADESLWAEVLNLGGYDLLARPFHRDEVRRVIASASRHFEPHSATELRPVAALGAA
jgi:DNA-binding response OmpR family regulator